MRTYEIRKRSTQLGGDLLSERVRADGVTIGDKWAKFYQLPEVPTDVPNLKALLTVLRSKPKMVFAIRSDECVSIRLLDTSDARSTTTSASSASA